VLDILNPGSVVGINSILSYSKYQFSAKAKGNLQILSLSAEALFNAAKQD
jgi:CRP-like cAMP-binding protein